MRNKNDKGNLKVYAVAGTHTCILSFDIAKVPANFLGFAISRTDKATNKTFWLKEQKCFQSVEPKPREGEQFYTYIAPVQNFIWKDFTLDPGHSYTYNITAICGSKSDIRSIIDVKTAGAKPAQSGLKNADTVSIDITTEMEFDNGLYGVYFDRGISGSQAYAEKFGNAKITAMPPDQQTLALNWLTRGLYQGLTNFVAQAQGKGYQLRCAFYEFHWPPFLQALKDAHKRGVDVQVMYGAIPSYKKINEDAIKQAGIGAFCYPRNKQVKQPHNKFMVLLKNNKPIMVWTGSTNISEVGIYGHCNTGHIVNDSTVAQAYLDYWNDLHPNPDHKTFTPKVMALQPDLPADIKIADLKQDITVFFSPRKTTQMLSAYASLIDDAKQNVCATFPFNVDPAFQAVFKKSKNYLRSVLLDKHQKSNSFKSGFNLRVVAGSYIKSGIDQWVQETNAKAVLNAGIVYIHNKFIVIDALTNNPVIITGSANFSKPSLTGNDENTLIIKSQSPKTLGAVKRIADIYFTEFERLYDHFSFREWYNSNQKKFSPFLDEKYTWHKRFISDKNSEGYKRRIMFSQMDVNGSGSNNGPATTAKTNLRAKAKAKAPVKKAAKKK